MLVGILFTVIVSLAIGTFSLLVCRARLKANNRYSTPAVSDYATFWFFMAIVWYLLACIDFFGYFGRIDIASLLIYIMQVAVGLSLVAVARAVWRMLGVPSRFGELIVVLAYLIFLVLFIWSLFYFGVRPQPKSFFASQIITASITL